MTEETRREFILRFAREYNLPAAAEGANITRQQAYQLLRDSAVREAVDEEVLARRRGELLNRIIREYERIAFSEGEDIRVGDRVRVLEQLRLLSADDDVPAGSSEIPPPLSIVCTYV